MFDDAEKWKAFVPKFADKNLDAFKTAAKNGNQQKMGQLIGDLVSVINDANSNNDKLLPRIGKVVSSVESSANNLDSWWGRWKLRFVVKAVDGTRDNKSYYSLDAAREWIARRLSVTSGQMNSDLKEIRNKVVEARDTLDRHAQVFVQGIKKIVKLTDDDTKKNAGKIQSIANELARDFKQTGEIIGKTNDALGTAKNVQMKHLHQH